MLLLSAWVCAPGASAQNLIPNPSFEEYTQCPGYPDINHYPVELAPPWTTPTLSSDYFHTCGNFWSRVPENRVGFEYARTGNAYAGFYPYAGYFYTSTGELISSREYLQVPLSAPLQKDSTYLLTIHVSLADRCGTTSDAFEVVFTNYFLSASPHPDYSHSSVAINMPPDIVNKPGNFLTQQDGWTALKWVYRARGGEAFMTMGVFRPNSEVSIQYLDGALQYYLYVDDVSLVPAPAHAADLMISGDLSVCDSVGEFSLSILSTAHSNFLWSTGDTARSITVTRPGTYTVWAEYEGCYWLHDTVEVVYRPAPELHLGPDTILCPADFPLTLSAPAGMDAYLWNTGDTTSTLSVSAPGLYTLGTTHHCGDQRDTIFIGMYDIPDLALGQDIAVCGDAPIAILLSAPPSSSATYEWNTGSTADAIVADAPGLWWVRAVHPCGVYADSVVITRQPLLSLALPQDTTYCLENGLYIELPPGFDTYHWSTGQSGAGIIIVEPGVYAATAAYACGVVRDTIVVHAAAALSLDLPERLNLQLGDEVHLDPGLGGRALRRVQWQPETGVDCPSCPVVSIQPRVTGVYTLEVEDAYGCLASQGVFLIVTERRRVFVPDAFSPNGDGINDWFTLYAGPEVRLINSLRVFDRWGGMVFERTDFPPNDESAGWDGSLPGRRPASTGTYIYAAELELINGERIAVNGEVSVLR